MIYTSEEKRTKLPGACAIAVKRNTVFFLAVKLGICIQPLPALGMNHIQNTHCLAKNQVSTMVNEAMVCQTKLLPYIHINELPYQLHHSGSPTNVIKQIACINVDTPQEYIDTYITKMKF